MSRAIIVAATIGILALSSCSKQPEDKGHRKAVDTSAAPKPVDDVATKSTKVADKPAGTDHHERKALARCAVISGDLDRLGCFDRLTKALKLDGPQPLPTEVSGTGKWIINRDKNPVDDSERVVIALVADSGAGVYGDSVGFFARCQSNKTEVYINWNSYVGDDSGDVYSEWKYVTTRIGDKEAKTRRWSVSTDKKATFARGNVIRLLRAMAGANKFLAQLTPYDESPITAVFDTTGMGNALKPLAAACGWKEGASSKH